MSNPHENPMTEQGVAPENESALSPSKNAVAQYIRVQKALVESSEHSVEQIFSADFVAHLPALLAKKFETKSGEEYTLNTVIEKHLALIANAQAHTHDHTPNEIIEAEQAFVRELVEKLADLPVKNWNLNAEQILENGGTNCSSSAALTQMLLESVQKATGISKIAYANPRGHAFNIVEFADGSIFYTDARNGIFENIGEQVVVTRRETLTIYKLREPSPRLNFRFIPALNNSHTGIIAAYFGNLLEVPDGAAGKFDEAFSELSDAERIEMQQEIKLLLTHPEISPEQIAGTRALFEKINAPIEDFYAEPGIQEEIATFEPVFKSQNLLGQIGTILKSSAELQIELKNRSEELTHFLLGTTEQFETTNPELTELISKYRDNRARTWTLMNRTKTYREQEIASLIQKI